MSAFFKYLNINKNLLAYWSILSFLFCIISCLFTYNYSINSIHVGFSSPRFQYFFWIFLISIFAFLFSINKFKKIAAFLLILFLFEIIFGFIAASLQKININVIEFFPDNFVSNRFDPHPLLVGIPSSDVKSYSSFINTNSIEIISHNSTNQRTVPNNRYSKNLIPIAVLGGSTVYDVALSDDDTWVNQLSILLGENFFITNNGVPGYTTAEHLIQTNFYLDRGINTMPVCAIYYLGWNDIRNFGIEDIDQGFAKFHLNSQLNNLRIINKERFSPLLSILEMLVINNLFIHNNINLGPVVKVDNNTLRMDESIKISLGNIETIIFLNNKRKIKTIYIPQIINLEKFTNKSPYGWLPRVRDVDVPKLLTYFNSEAKKIVTSNNAVFFDVSNKEFNDEDFRDNGHFSPEGAAKFSKKIFYSVEKMCN